MFIASNPVFFTHKFNGSSILNCRLHQNDGYWKNSHQTRWLYHLHPHPPFLPLQWLLPWEEPGICWDDPLCHVIPMSSGPGGRRDILMKSAVQGGQNVKFASTKILDFTVKTFYWLSQTILIKLFSTNKILCCVTHIDLHKLYVFINKF